MILKIVLAALLAYCGPLVSLYCETIDGQKAPPLPIIWGHSDRSASVTGSFRIMSEIRVADKGGSFLAEEWADGQRKLFRLDAIPMVSDKQAGRRTLLVDGASNERYSYEPFKCSPLANDTLSKTPLMQLFPHQHEFVIAGLGSIWLYALAKGRTVTFKAADRSAMQQGDSESNESNSIRQVLNGYDKFTVDGDSDFPFRIEFYFLSNGLRRDNGDIETETLAAIHLVELQTLRIKLAAKVIEIDTQIQAAAKIINQQELFELPLGYGCTRSDESKMIAENGAQMTYKPPEDCYKPAADGRARICNIEVVASLPANQDDDMDKWKTYTSSLRFSAGNLAGRTYLIQERSEFARFDQVNESTASALLGQKSVLKRTKRIWELEKQLDEEGKVSDGLPTLFQLGEQMQLCEAVRAARLDREAAFEVPLALPPGERQDNTASNNKLLAGPSLDPDMMRELFISTDNYHFIRANVAPWVRFRDVVEEKRLERFELRGSIDGQIIWAGPVSIVRRFFVLSQQTEDSEYMQQPVDAESSDVYVDLYLLSKARDQILARIHLRLSPIQPVDEAYLHRELDISACFRSFSRPNEDNELELAKPIPFNPRPLPKGSLSFVVTYPLDLDDDTAELLVRQEEQVYIKFLNNLIALSGEKLDPLQLINLNVDIEYDQIKVSGTLLKWPELFSFTKIPMMRLSRAAKRELLLGSELKGSETACAVSCSHIGCTSFSYCSKSKICDMATGQPRVQAGEQQLALELDESCNVWIKRHAKAQALDQALPVQLFNRIRGEILSTKGDDDEQSPVAIRISLDPQDKEKSLLLIPDAINTHDNRLEHNSLLINDDGHIAKSYELKADDPLDQSTEFVHVEFQVLFEGRKLVQAQNDQAAFPFEEATHMNYDDCELFCRENDCKSFSHCQLEQTCRISHLEQTKKIEASSVKDDFCYLLARMPLSKFHKIGGLSPLNYVATLEPEANQMTENSRIHQTGSRRDCAIQCLEQSDESFTCRSFYFCAGTNIDCFLMADRQPAVEVDELMEPKTSVQIASEPTCDLYQRSDLIEYNRLAAKEIDPEMIKTIPGATVSLLLGLDADACASECTHANANCMAFHVCSHSDEDKGDHQISCAILTDTNELSDLVKLRLDLMNSKLLRVANMCTTFVSKIQKVARVPWREIDHFGEFHQGVVSNGSNWILNALFIMIGIALGYGLTWLIVMRSPPLSVALMRIRH